MAYSSAGLNMNIDNFEELYPFPPNYLDLGNGINYHYLDEGQGEPILMLHGNPTWSFYYRNLVSHFSKTHRVIAPDHIGCGLSDKPKDYSYRLATHIENVEKLVKKLDLKNITLVVHDWGGPIGFGFATINPERIKRIVVLNTAAFLLLRFPWYLKLLASPTIGQFLVRGLNIFLRAACLLGSGRFAGIRGAVKRGFLRPYRSWKNRIAIYRFIKDIPFSNFHPTRNVMIQIENSLGKLKDKPMQVYWGKKDPVFNLHYLARFKKEFPEAQFFEYEDAGHFVLEDKTEEIIAGIEEFIKRGTVETRYFASLENK